LTDLTESPSALDGGRLAIVPGVGVGVHARIETDRSALSADLPSATGAGLAARAVARFDHAFRAGPHGPDTRARAHQAAASDAGPRRSTLRTRDGKPIASRSVAQSTVGGRVALCVAAAERRQRGESEEEDEPVNASAHPASASKVGADLRRRRRHAVAPTESRHRCHTRKGFSSPRLQSSPGTRG